MLVISRHNKLRMNDTTMFTNILMHQVDRIPKFSRKRNLLNLALNREQMVQCEQILISTVPKVAVWELCNSQKMNQVSRKVAISIEQDATYIAQHLLILILFLQIIKIPNVIHPIDLHLPWQITLIQTCPLKKTNENEELKWLKAILQFAERNIKSHCTISQIKY